VALSERWRVQIHGGKQEMHSMVSQQTSTHHELEDYLYVHGGWTVIGVLRKETRQHSCDSRAWPLPLSRSCPLGLRPLPQTWPFSPGAEWGQRKFYVFSPEGDRLLAFIYFTPVFRLGAVIG
jgi:hypothetical protein